MAIQSLRQNGCKLEYQNEAGDWIQFADLSGCVIQAPEPQANTDEQYCSIASYIVEFLNAKFNDLLNAVDATGDAAAAGSFFLLLAGPIGISVIAVVQAAAIIKSASTSLLRAGITAEVIETAKCQLYCILKANSGWSNALVPDDGSQGLQNQIMIAWRNKISKDSGTNVALQEWIKTVNIFSPQVWQQRAYLGSLSTRNDCIACECISPCRLQEAGSNYLPPLANLDGTWTLLGTPTPNTPDGLYEGVYRLLYDYVSCCRLELVQVVTHQTPSGKLPAGILECGMDPSLPFLEKISLNDLNGQCFNAFMVRSSIPFEIKVRVTDCVPAASGWCYAYDFTQSDGGWAKITTAGQYTPGTGWVVGQGIFPNNVLHTGIYIEKAMPANVGLTSVTMEYTGGGGSGNWTGVLMPSPAPHDVINRIGGAVARNPKTHIWEANAGVPYSPPTVRLELTGQEGAHESVSGAITKVIFRGNGANPFGANNCV
jgi:hypothetical protein